MRIEKLGEVRRSRGLTQDEFSRRTGINSQSRVSSIERGLHVSPELAQRCADVLMCRVSDLVQPEEPTLTFKLSELNPEVLALLNRR
jgi:transcriptional regulator with XRE-family HTH domain